MDMDEHQLDGPNLAGKFTQRSPSVNVENDPSRHAITNRNLDKYGSSTMSPHGSRTINYSSTMPGGDESTDMSCVNAYKSAAKMRIAKKG